MKIGFIEPGNMNSAIIDGMLANKVQPSSINVTNRTISKLKKYELTGINLYLDSATLVADSDIIVLGIKPGDYQEWLEANPLGDKILVSIGAGISSQFLQNYTDKYVLAMPNTPAKVGKGSTLIVESPSATKEVKQIFEAIGSVTMIDESEMDRYTLVTGCSPAYFFTFVDHLERELSEKFDLDPLVVRKLLIEVMDGSVQMLRGEESPHQLTDNVCSPGGVTIEVIKELNKGLSQYLTSGFANAIERTNQLRGE